MLDNLHSLYQRTASRLAEIAEQVEAALGLEPLTDRQSQPDAAG